MQYSDARPRIQSGDLIGLRHYGLGAKIVCLATRSVYSHVGVAWRVADRVMLLEAVIPKVRIFPLSKLIPFTWVPISHQWTEEAEEFAMSRVGESYSIAEAIRGFLNFTRDDSRWQCAEYARAILRANGLDLAAIPTPEAVICAALKLNGGKTQSITSQGGGL